MLRKLVKRKSLIRFRIFTPRKILTEFPAQIIHETVVLHYNQPLTNDKIL